MKPGWKGLYGSEWNRERIASHGGAVEWPRTEKRSNHQFRHTLLTAWKRTEKPVTASTDRLERKPKAKTHKYWSQGRPPWLIQYDQRQESISTGLVKNVDYNASEELRKWTR
jgi:hypothetical protein